MDFRYIGRLKQIPNCPPTQAEAGRRMAFRFVQSDLNHENNFLPPAILKPTRVFPEDQTCSAFALSMFDTSENAVSEFVVLSKYVRNARKSIGTHLAKGSIDETHGAMTPVEENGHFNLFAAETADFVAIFETTMELP